jgi:hypothetical protein
MSLQLKLETTLMGGVLPIIVLSGEECNSLFKDFDKVETLVKPLELEELFTKVRKLLDAE